MREIKYKFWLGHTKKMTYEHSLIDIAHSFWDFTEDIIPLQYTGLKDKNGKEIYEGDIISSCNGSINGTPWMNKDFVVEFKTGKFNVPTWSIDSTHWIEVIGNIYESKELLNKK